jgi:phosphate transport system substrate-binding protein
VSRVGLVLALLFATVARADIPAPPANRLELRGSGNVMAALEDLAEKYMTEHAGTTIILERVSAERGLKALINGVAEMAMAVDEIPDDMQRLADEHHVKLEKTCIFIDGVVPVVAETNPVTNITLDDLRDVFSGKIKNWKELGGPDGAIEVVSHDRSSGAYEIFKGKVLGDEAVVTPAAKIAGNEMPRDIGPLSIGYAGMNSVQKPLKALTVNGFAASPKSIAAGDYLIVRQSCLYQRAPGSDLGNAFIEYVFTPTGQEALVSHNTVPSKRAPASAPAVKAGGKK